MLATVLQVTPRTVTTVTNKLQDLGLITKTRRPGYFNDINHYSITMYGNLWLNYLVNAYKVHTGIFRRRLLSIGLLLSLSSSSFTLLKEDYVYNPPLKRELLTCARARRVAMGTPIEAKGILAATELLSLSKWGQIRLSGYPNEAIEHANSALRASKVPKDDPFRWFCSLCEQWCKKNNTEPNLSLMRRLAVEHGMPDNPAFIVARKPIAIPLKGKAMTNENRKAFSEEQAFIERVQFLDKANKQESPNDFMRILQAGFMKEIQPYMDKADDPKNTTK
jgi:hypothetical protein